MSELSTSAMPASSPPNVIDYRTSQAPMAGNSVGRVGEELPIFCEKCGYALYGLPQIRCQTCTILHFHCPECGHHQPINTLRPAAQRLLSRLRATALLIVILLKLGYLGMLGMAWLVMGSEWSHTYQYSPRGGNNYLPAELSYEMLWSFVLFGAAYGSVTRLLLLRWRSGWKVGLILAVLVTALVFFGAWLDMHDRPGVQIIISNALLISTIFAAGSIVVFATVAWPIWVGLVRLLLPRRAGDALLAWQHALSTPKDEAIDDRSSVDLTR